MEKGKTGNVKPKNHFETQKALKVLCLINRGRSTKLDTSSDIKKVLSSIPGAQEKLKQKKEFFPGTRETVLFSEIIVHQYFPNNHENETINAFSENMKSAISDKIFGNSESANLKLKSFLKKISDGEDDSKIESDISKIKNSSSIKKTFETLVYLASEKTFKKVFPGENMFL